MRGEAIEDFLHREITRSDSEFWTITLASMLRIHGMGANVEGRNCQESRKEVMKAWSRVKMAALVIRSPRYVPEVENRHCW